MIEPKTLILGALAAVCFSLTGYVLIPALGLEDAPITLADGSVYPAPLTDLEAEGRAVYRDLGCMYCHTQQVRPETFGVDQLRGWGSRGSVPQDYVGQHPPFLGTMRTGPDLANIGARQPSDVWHMLHLYDPQITSPGSNMPPFRFLFEQVDAPNAAAVPIAPELLPEGVVVIPTRRGKALVAYLKSLHQPADLAGGTNGH